MRSPRRPGRGRPRMLLVACLAALSSATLPSLPAATAASPVRIMPAGDSITHGSDGLPTYRYFVWQQLAASGRAVDLVGSMDGVRDGSYTADPAFDQDHEGHGGYRADQLVTGWPGREPGTIGTWVAAAQPDVILLHIGTNDTRQCQSVASTLADIGDVIAAARQAKADVTVLLAQIIPAVGSASRTCAPDVPRRITELNAGIASLAASSSTEASRIVLVDQHTGFDVAADTSDGVHPNESGDRKMAARWLAALDDVLGPVPTTTTTTAPPATTTVPAAGTSAPPPMTTTAPPPVTTTTTTAPPATTTTTAPPPPATTKTTPSSTEVPAGYWMLGAKGSVYAFGDAAHLGNADVGRRTAVDIEAAPDLAGYWVVDDAGTVHAFGSARHRGDGVALAAGERVTSMSATASGGGYWLFTDRGGVLPFGDATRYGDMVGHAINGPVLDSTRSAGGGGYYLVGSDGGVFSFGDAAFRGSMGHQPLNGRVVSLAPAPDGSGYWLVGEDGGIFAFGAGFRGSMGGRPLNRPVVGMVPYGSGYLLVASDGGIFSFSDKPFVGSLGDRPPAVPIVSVAAVDGQRR